MEKFVHNRLCRPQERHIFRDEVSKAYDFCAKGIFPVCKLFQKPHIAKRRNHSKSCALVEFQDSRHFHHRHLKAFGMEALKDRESSFHSLNSIFIISLFRHTEPLIIY